MYHARRSGLPGGSGHQRARTIGNGLRTASDAIDDRIGALQRVVQRALVGGIELQSGDRVGSAGGSGASAAGNRTGPVARGQRAHQVAADESIGAQYQHARCHTGEPAAMALRMPLGGDGSAIAAAAPSARTSHRKCAASRNESATTVSVGLAWLEVGKVAALATNRLPTPCTRQLPSTTLPADVGGNSAKFTVPVVINGHVYVAGEDALTVYGLAP